MEHIIFVDENIPLLAKALKPCGVIINYTGRNLSKNELINSGCSALFIRSTTKIKPELIEGTSVKFIGTATSGIDHVDIQYLKEKDIKFAYAPGSNANSVAEYVVFSILKWKDITQSEIKNTTIGIIGYGNIGKLVAKYSNNMGLKILVNDPPLKDTGFYFPDYTEYAELNDILKVSAIITNHVPLTKNGSNPTFNLISEQNIKFIKPESLFIHTSRGGIVSENALISKQNKVKIYTAIDVWENEPNINKELLDKGMIATPHVAGYSRNGKIRGAKMMAEEFEVYSGIKPDYSELINESSLYQPLSSYIYSDYDKLYTLLRKSREIDEDTVNLKIILNEPNIQTDVFDLLRKNYPARREIL